MPPIEPSAQQYRAAATALIVVAALTSVVVALAWVSIGIDGPLLLPIIMGYFLFNAGFPVAAIRGSLQTSGRRLGAAAVSLNFVAMLLTDFTLVCTLLSVCAVLASVVAAYMLFKDAGA